MTSLIDIEELKTFLTSKSISFPEEQLENIVQIQLMKIQSETGRELESTSHTDVEFNFNFNSTSYNIKHYPVEEIKSVKVDDEYITSDMYILDKENGRIKFLSKLNKGNALIVEYVSKESDNFIKSKIIPLLYDMVYYDLQDDKLKNISSMSEKNVSVSYDTNTSLNATIIQRLEKLKSRKGTLTRML